jgi:hypothetical protein
MHFFAGKLPLSYWNFLKRFDSYLLVTTLDADDHFVLIAYRHLHLHWVVLLHDIAGRTDAGIQQALEAIEHAKAEGRRN